MWAFSGSVYVRYFPLFLRFSGSESESEPSSLSSLSLGSSLSISLSLRSPRVEVFWAIWNPING